MTEKSFVPFYGEFLLVGGVPVWTPNPNLNMTANEQYQHNIEAGHINVNGTVNHAQERPKAKGQSHG